MSNIAVTKSTHTNKIRKKQNAKAKLTSFTSLISYSSFILSLCRICVTKHTRPNYFAKKVA